MKTLTLFALLSAPAIVIAAPAKSPLVAAGKTYVYEIGDYNALDKVTFRIERAGADLAVAYEGDSKGSLTFTAAALKDAGGQVSMNQGDVTDEHYKALKSPISTHVPPFLLGRDLFAKVKKGEKVSLAHSPKAVPLSVAGTGEVTIEGAKYNAVELKGTDDFQMWVVDDATWPFVVSVFEGGIDHVKLVGATVTPKTPKR